jgi:hypothetical protein
MDSTLAATIALFDALGASALQRSSNKLCA